MRALIHVAYGPPSKVLAVREVQRPRADAGEALVRVRAAGVAKGNWLITRGLPYIARPSYGLRAPKYRVAGLEFAGVVEDVGPGVTSSYIGDEVFGYHQGALAEYVASPVDALAPKPANVSFAQAATVPISGIAALQAVRDAARVQLGQRVLVVGASGGVGSFAVQISKALGAEVTGVASTKNLARLRELGADHVIDYMREEVGARPARYHAVIDIAGNRKVSTLRKALTPRGTLVIVGGTGGRWTMGFERTVRGMLLGAFSRHRVVGLVSSPNLQDLATLGALMAEGRLAPLVHAPLPLDRAAEAIDSAGRDHGCGTPVVTPDRTVS